MKPDFLLQAPPKLQRIAKYFFAGIPGIMLCMISPLQAQQKETEVIANAGETYQITPDVLIAWTLGESIVESYSDGQMLLVQGFHQPKLKILVVEEAESFKNIVSVFPNPAVEFINIRLGESESPLLKPKRMKAELHDLSGRLVHEVEFESSEHRIDVHLLANGVYMLLLKSVADNTFIGSYSVEKLK
jgi:hypothetical protein